MHGVLNFLKPPGMTSHDAVAFVRRTFNTKRVGHTGTLDPAAAGVLPICIGQATRLVEYLQAGRKTYIAEITFGIETDTLDATGEVTATSDASHVNLDNLRAALDQFRGTIWQTPPMYSAIKRDGKKLYELAREGADEAELDIQPRQVEIYSLVVPRDFASSTRTRAMLRIECGSGTYIRSLVRDIGRTLGCGATMSFLVRTQNGAFEIDEAHTPEEILPRGESAVIPIRDVLTWCAHLVIEDDDAAAWLSHGRVLSLEQTEKARRANTFYTGLSYAPYQHRSFAMLGGVTDVHRALFVNKMRNLAILAFPLSDVAPISYKPEKVFFLDRDE